MASLLDRLARLSYRRRGRVLAVWALLFTAMLIGAGTLSGPTSDTFSIPGTEAQRGLDLLEERMPEAAAGTASARVVFTASDDGALTDTPARAAIDAAVTAVAALPHVASARSPFDTGSVSPDGRTVLVNVAYDVTADEITDEDRRQLLEAVSTAEAAGVDVEVGGSATQAAPNAGHTSEIVGLLVAAVVLAITFGAIVAAGLPLLMAILGVAFGMVGIQIATGFFDLSSTTMTLATMLGLAVGIDYALFIVSRYRHELVVRGDGEAAAGIAVGTAGSAVVFAGLTVAIALAALTVVGIPFLAAMGLAAAATVLVAVAIALTLLPALLGFAGTRVLSRRARLAMAGDQRLAADQAPAGGRALAGKRSRAADIVDSPARHPMGERWAAFVIRRRVPVVAAAIALLGVMAIPALGLRLGLPNDGTAAPDSSPRLAYDQVAAGFGPGLNGPLVVAVDLVDSPDRAAGVARVEAGLQSTEGIASLSPAMLNAAGDFAIISVVPTAGPSEEATEDLVRTIRDRAGAWRAETGAEALVTGETAVAIDVSDKLGNALVPYLLVIIGLAFVLLTLVFRSLLVPLKAVLGFLLSVVATFGGVVAVFQWGWLRDVVGLDSTAPILSFLPIILIGLLFGLAMDYEVFLVTRMREAFVHGAHADDAVREGFRHGARVVTAAAAIMIGVFAGFVFAEDAVIKSIGFALALGVLLDALVVRMTIVPAVMSLMGDRAWFLPRWLDRVLPDVDVEGAELERRHPAAPAPAPLAAPADSEAHTPVGSAR